MTDSTPGGPLTAARSSSPPIDGSGPPALAADFDAVYRSRRADLIRTATLLVGSRAVAEELVHDAFLRLHGRFAEVENPPGFLRTSVVRLCLTWSARRTGERHRLALLPGVEPAPAPEIDETIAALDRLSPERRVAIILRYYVDLSYAEMADHLGCREATARTRVHRGLADLRKEIER